MLRELISVLEGSPSDGFDVAVPLGYRIFTEPIKWFLEVDYDGRGRIVEGSGNPPRPTLKRTSKVVPLLLVDEAPYVLGKGNGIAPDRLQRCFDSFWALLEKAQRETANAELATILRVREHWPPEGMDKVEAEDTLAVTVAGKPPPFLDPAIQAFWLTHTSGEVISSREGQCSVCGKEKRLLRLLPFGVKG
ncbi:MAG: type I-C CRISPR-associated protein Cas8c/Csd1, partial [Nitrososphaerota archaeon]|nr:type I-C CRISPR-associated protein Cas8c/Csd1 [Nitrososphaerota archaeon]